MSWGLSWPHVWATLRSVCVGFVLRELYDHLTKWAEDKTEACVVDTPGNRFIARTGPKPFIAALVSDFAMRRKLVRVLRERADLRFASGWPDLAKLVARRPPSVVFVDPLANPHENPVRRIHELASSCRTSLILYCALSPEFAGTALTLGQSGIRHVVFRRYDDSPSRLREVLAAAGVRLPDAI